MGRKSRSKRERREDPAYALERLLRPYSRRSVLDLLEVASVSPTAAHRGATIGAIFDSVVRRRRPGTVPATPADLPVWAAAARQINSDVGTIEDFRPHDIRADVLVRWNDGVFRMVPGSLERPTAMVGRHARLAESIDPFVVGALGFGLSDVGEVVLRRTHEVASELAPAWLPGEAPEVGTEPRVSEAELAAAGALRPLEDIAATCSNPERAALAVDYFAVENNAIRFEKSGVYIR